MSLRTTGAEAESMKNLFLAAFVLAIGGCGGGNNNPNQIPTSSDGVVNEQFACGAETCESARHYCVTSTDGTNTLSQNCVSRPQGCLGCDCMRESAYTHFPSRDHCKGELGCGSERHKFTLTCKTR